MLFQDRQSMQRDLCHTPKIMHFVRFNFAPFPHFLASPVGSTPLRSKPNLAVAVAALVVLFTNKVDW